MGVIKKEDIDVTHGLIFHHLSEIKKQLNDEKQNWDEVANALRRIEYECTSGIDLVNKIKGGR